MLLSVVVIGRNEGERLALCFESVRDMHWPEGEGELIYVDSGSRDNSMEIARAFDATAIQVGSASPCAAVARNAGWKNARGKFILFLDGDTLLHPDFVKEGLKLFDAPEVAVVCGHRRELDTQSSFYDRALDLDWIGEAGDVAYSGGDALMRRSVLKETGGFDRILVAGEEPELCRRIRGAGYRIVRLDVPMTLHTLGIRRFSQYWRRCMRTGFAYAAVSQMYKETDDPLWRYEAQYNLLKGGVLLFLLLLAIWGSWLLFSPYPLLTFLFLFAFLALRTALNSSHANDWTSRILYGLHSQFQHLPLFFGQLSYWLKRILRRKPNLVEYK